MLRVKVSKLKSFQKQNQKTSYSVERISAKHRSLILKRKQRNSSQIAISKCQELYRRFFI